MNNCQAGSWQEAGKEVFRLLFILVIVTMSSGARANDAEVVVSTEQPGVFVVQQEALQSQQEYEDTDFGDFLYNEASDQSRDEVADLLIKENPSVSVFLHGISMGLGLDEVLDAAVRLDNQRGRDFTTAAISLIPLVSITDRYSYARYGLDDLEQPYSAEQVIERFFEDRAVLFPYPDWQQDQVHFDVPVAELKALSTQNPGVEWYRSKSTATSENRPIFISLYESSKSVLVDNRERIDEAYAADPDSTLPVVFIFNHLTERSIDELGYDKTVRGVQQAYLENSLMVTPTPEWADGEFHVMAEVAELKELFEIPQQEDYEPEVWQKLIEEEKRVAPEDRSLLIVVLPSGSAEDVTKAASGLLYADDAGIDLGLNAVMNNGLVLNRPERVAALDFLGVTTVPVAFYYVDQHRVKPYNLGGRGLKLVAVGAGLPGHAVGIPTGIRPGTPGGGGFGPKPPPPPPPPPECASPPCR